MAEIFPKLPKSPRLAAVCLELVQGRPLGFDLAGWMPALRATGTPDDVILKWIEDVAAAALVSPARVALRAAQHDGYCSPSENPACAGPPHAAPARAVWRRQTAAAATGATAAGAGIYPSVANGKK